MLMFLLRSRPETPLVRLIATWIARHTPGQVSLVATEIYEEFGLITQVRPETKLEGRDERAAYEIVRLELARGGDGCILLFDSSDVQTSNFLVIPPDSVQIRSVCGYLDAG